MITEIDKIDIVNMLKGTAPPYELIEELEKSGVGNFTGGFSDGWRWNEFELKTKSEQDLFEIYTKIKTYWIRKGIWEK